MKKLITALLMAILLIASSAYAAGTLKDARGLARDVTNVGHLGTGDYEIAVTDDRDLEYIMSLVKQLIVKTLSK